MSYFQLLAAAALCAFAQSSVADNVVLYPALAHGELSAIEGRVVERKQSDEAQDADRKRDNFRRNLDLMINDERRFYPVTVRMGERGWQTRTDHEGYFRIQLESRPALPEGWHEVTASTAAGSGATTLLRVPHANTHGVISDVDDTIMITEVNSKRRMLANTFLRNAAQRDAVPGIAAFYRQLIAANPTPELAPLVYLSASPRQLHSNIEAFLAHNRFPRGVLITKRVTDDATSEPIADQVAYKTAKIENILSSLPHVRFTLIGDDGEHDPEIYADIQRRFPERIAAVWIRQVNPDPKRKRIVGQGVLDEALKAFSVPLE
jgi:phosphatidate phosphatase APP1